MRVWLFSRNEFGIVAFQKSPRALNSQICEYLTCDISFNVREDIMHGISKVPFQIPHKYCARSLHVFQTGIKIMSF